MNPQEAAYALSKQIPSMECIHTNYGNLDLDLHPEMKKAVQDALTPILSKIANQDQATPETVSQKGSLLEHSSKLNSCRVCGKKLSPFENAIHHLFAVMDHPDRWLCSDCYEKKYKSKG